MIMVPVVAILLTCSSDVTSKRYMEADYSPDSHLSFPQYFLRCLKATPQTPSNDLELWVSHLLIV